MSDQHPPQDPRDQQPQQPQQPPQRPPYPQAPPPPHWQPPPTPAARRHHNRSLLLTGGIIGGILVLLIGMGALLAGGEPEPPVEVVDRAASASASTTSPPAKGKAAAPATTKPATTQPPATTRPPSATDTLKAALAAELGTSNRDRAKLASVKVSRGTVAVRWAIDDNLTERFIRIGAKGDTLDILRTVHTVGKGRYAVHLVGTYPLTDAYGNTAEQVVVDLTYSRATLARINFDGVDRDRLYDLADGGTVHPEMRG